MAVKALDFIALRQIAVNVGDTTPNPGVAGAIAWSTTITAEVIWNGSSWQRTSLATALTLTQVEIDFGSTPVRSARFTVTDAAVSGGSKVAVWESGVAATGRADGDHLWDSIAYAAIPGTGQFTLDAFATGFVVGKRNVIYQIG